MSEHLNPLDATFLELEQADDSAHMHIGALLIFEPGEHGVPRLEELCAHFERRLGALPRYRQRLSAAHTGGLTWPAWEEDPRFDLAEHVHRAALPAPGGDGELMEWVSDYWSHRLDRRRPLWDAVLVEGLAGGRWALCTKTHHSMVDGVGSIDVGNVLLDTSRTPAERPPLEAPAPVEDARHGPLGRVASAARSGADVALHPRRLAEMASHSAALAELVLRDEVIPAPATSLNVPIGTTRRFDTVRVPLPDIKRIKHGLGGTVNDVVLAAVSGGLRRLLVARGESPPAQGLRAMVPVSVRTAGDHLSLGNKISSLFVHLPVAGESPLARYAEAMDQAERLKSGSQAIGSSTLVDLTAHAPPVVHSMLAQSLFASRLFNVTVTNVPGPQTTLYALGSRLLEVHGLVPLAAEHCVGIAVLSYDGNVSFGLVGDRDTVPDLDVLRDGIEEELDALRLLARLPQATA